MGGVKQKKMLKRKNVSVQNHTFLHFLPIGLKLRNTTKRKKISAQHKTEDGWKSANTSLDDVTNVHPNVKGVCETCGALGFTNALIYCEKCDVPQHRYCAKKLTFDEDIIWFCDACLPMSPEVSHSDEQIEIRSRIELKKRKKLYRSQFSKEKAATRLGQFASHDGEIIDLVEDNESDIVCTVTENQPYNSSPSAKSASAQNYSMPADNPECVELVHPQTASGHGRHLEQCENFTAQPIINPIWRGAFEVGNMEMGVIEGVAVHMSNKACLRAEEEASMFPPLVCMEMHPRADIWPKSFSLSPPNDESIALYLLPTSKISEKAYDQLVEAVIRKQAAMSASMENAELLVFPSTELPLAFQKFQGRYYLWGVFKGKKSSAQNEVGPARKRLRPTALTVQEAKGAHSSVRSPVSPLSDCDSSGSAV